MTSTVSLRHLRAFITVAELGSVTRAADALYRAQSAITRSVHELETVIGESLFERKSSGMLLTVFGNTLLFRARRAAQEFELARDEIYSKIKTPAGAMKTSILSMLFNERRLQIFVKLAESHHMPTVANALGITQPAVSASISDLETSLGATLFQRTPKGMLLTEAGALLLFRAKRALAELRHAEADISALKGTTQGRVVVGALPLSRTTILPRAIASVIAAHPQLRITTIEGPFDSLAARLRAGDIDFILGALRPPEYANDLHGEPLLEDKMSVIVRRGHPLTQKSKVTLDDLMRAQWILSGKGTPARTLFELSMSRKDTPAPTEVVETSDLAILRGLLLHSDMVTAISAQQLEYEIHSNALQVLDFDLPRTSRTIGITQREESHPSPGAVVLMDAIREVTAQMERRAANSGHW
ncbi:LysR family transcriptional regulator [Herbaspirillum rhizosphaerae]|uniref:LysR family transcriptional regulator n=1 Tax=Herbaspirillum rhizosphaerae TaxID=346179 RepID=UPI00067A9EDD|nr:LysR family transcriptional regulator [Herbaspirillum rhizosphaerae]